MIHSFSEFESRPTAIQRKDQGQDYKLTWKLSYNICDFLSSDYLRDFPFRLAVRLQLSTYGTIGSTYLDDFSCSIDDVISINNVYSTRASFNMDNNSITFFLKNIALADAGDYTLTLYENFWGRPNPQQDYKTTLFVNGL